MEILDLRFLGFPRAIASFLLIGPGGPVLVESGPATTVDQLEAALAEHGYRLEDVAHLLVTHIHLDHAGAAGHLARRGATVYVHHRGAAHLIDPSRLLASAARIYADQMDHLWGTTLAVPAEQVVELEDGQVIEVAGLHLTAVDTPGHAGHHHSYLLGDTLFTGDVAGVRLPGQRHLSVPAPPPEFDLELWRGSLGRIRELAPTRICPTHFGCFEDVDDHLDRLEELLEASAEFVRRRMEQGTERDSLVRDYLEWTEQRARAEGTDEATWQAYCKANPLAMSVDGLMRYWRKRG